MDFAEFENDKLMPASFFAKLFDCTDRYIRKLAQEGNIPKDRSKKDRYPMIGTIRAYVKFLQARVPQSATGANQVDFMAEKTRLTYHQANIAQLDEEIKRSNLIPSQLIEKTLFDVFSAFRAKALSIPTKMAHQVVATNNIQEAESLLSEQINEALIEMSEHNVERIIFRGDTESAA